MTLRAEPGPEHAPDHAGARPGVEAAAQGRGQLGDQRGQGVGQVLGQVRARGVPAAPGEPHAEAVGGAGDGTDAQAHLPDVERGVAVEPEGVGDVLEPAGGDHLQGASGHDLLGGLEEQPDPTGEPPLAVQPLQGEPGPEQRRGVHVVAAGVRDLVGAAAPGVLGLVADRERVEVGAQRDHGRPSAGSPISAIRPDFGRSWTLMPSWASRSTTFSVVRLSSHASSGWRWRSRRNATSSSESEATAVLMAREGSAGTEVGRGSGVDIAPQVSAPPGPRPAGPRRRPPAAARRRRWRAGGRTSPRRGSPRARHAPPARCAAAAPARRGPATR